jgi:hypothetical protein
MPPEAVVAALRAVWNALDGMKIPAAIMGGLAMSAWKHLRFTEDVDLVIGVGEAMSRDVVKGLVAAGMRTKLPDPFIRIDDARFLQLLYEPPGLFLNIQIDLHLATSEFHRQAIERRVPLAATELGFEAAVVSCEDLILFKLLADRMLDRVDVAALLEINRDSLDMSHLANWTRRLRFVRGFRVAWSEAFGNDPPPF